MFIAYFLKQYSDIFVSNITVSITDKYLGSTSIAFNGDFNEYGNQDCDEDCDENYERDDIPFNDIGIFSILFAILNGRTSNELLLTNNNLMNV